jgi:hypothetical protein
MLGQQEMNASLQLVSTDQQGIGVQVVLQGVPVRLTYMISRLEVEPGEPRLGEFLSTTLLAPTLGADDAHHAL